MLLRDNERSSILCRRVIDRSRWWSGRGVLRLRLWLGIWSRLWWHGLLVEVIEEVVQLMVFVEVSGQMHSWRLR